MADERRIEGQIWLGKEQPNVLKYFAGGREYWTVSATTHFAGSKVEKGQLLAVDTSSAVGGKVRPAQWPQDASSIVGMAMNSDEGLGEVKILNYGYVEFDEEALADLDVAFVAPSDLNVKATASPTAYASTLEALTGGNGWETAAGDHGVGQPIYWFTGRMLRSGASSYKWIDPSNYAGKLTFATPVGHKPKHNTLPWNDDSFNVNFKQLPKIGNVVSYKKNASGKLTNLIIHINFSTFANKVQFEYPAVGLKEYSEAHTTQTLVIRHGLFPNSNTIIPHVDINMWGYSDSDVETNTGGTTFKGEAFGVHPGYDSYIGAGVDKRTEIEILSDTTFHYKLVGEVNYNF